MKDIVIVGSGGMAKDVAFLLEDINRVEPRWNILGFIEKGANAGGQNIGRYTVIGDDDWLEQRDQLTHVALGIGSPAIIQRLFERFSGHKYIDFPNLIHPSAIGDWERISMGIGNLICAASVLSTDILIGSGNIFNVRCTIGHDSTLGNYNIVNPTANLSGGVVVGDGCLIGAGAQIRQYISIVSQSTVGMGAVVTRDVLEPGTYAGVPARRLGK